MPEEQTSIQEEQQNLDTGADAGGEDGDSSGSGHKKVGLPEELIFIMMAIAVWVVGLFAAATGVGIIVSEALDAAFGTILEIYLWLRGARGVWQLIMPVIGTISEASVIIPGLVISLMIAYYLMNHPKLTKAVGKLAPVAGKALK